MSFIVTFFMHVYNIFQPYWHLITSLVPFPLYNIFLLPFLIGKNKYAIIAFSWGWKIVKIRSEIHSVVFASFTLLCSRLVVYLVQKTLSGKSWGRDVEESIVVIMFFMLYAPYNNPESIDDMEDSYAFCCSVQSMPILCVLILSFCSVRSNSYQYIANFELFVKF